RTLHADGGLLGIFPEDRYTDCTEQLRSGDRLILYTDGVEVCLTEKADAMQEGWHRMLMELHPLPTSELIAALAEKIDSNAGSLAPKDDLTILIAEIQ
ncbi:MAG TPA: SpoIIE family protein phosphatase, partial [Tepidisphaeraceae bacterium]